MQKQARWIGWVILGAVSAFIALDSTAAQEQKPRQDEEKLVVKVYPINNLVVPRPDYPYRASEIPTAKSVEIRPEKKQVLSGGELGGMGGGIGGGGGGFFQVNDDFGNSATLPW